MGDLICFEILFIQNFNIYVCTCVCVCVCVYPSLLGRLTGGQGKGLSYSEFSTVSIITQCRCSINIVWAELVLKIATKEFRTSNI